MKTLFVTIIAIIGFATTAVSQVVNQINIFPSNPTTTDTIYVISDISYYGNCTYGMVHSYTYLTDSTILIIPTYCGYGDSTLCNSIDTFKIGPFPTGNYNISIDYHQGSICPLSGFDATIIEFDTLLTINDTSATSSNQNINSLINIYPNPVNDYITIDFRNFTTDDYQLIISNLVGRTVLNSTVNQRQLNLDLSTYADGMYFISIVDSQNNLIEKRKIVIQ